MIAINPLFWLELSLFLVALSLTALLITALPAFLELRQAARSAEKLFDTLNREFPPTLEIIRLTGIELSELTEDLNSGVKSATQVVQQADKGLNTLKNQTDNVQMGTRSILAGVKAAWKTWQKPLSNQAHFSQPLPNSPQSSFNISSTSPSEEKQS